LAFVLKLAPFPPSGFRQPFVEGRFTGQSEFSSGRR